ncbi:TetR/AcrR family transcriptional regulator [Pseudomonas sp. NPDC088368]|jgi:AcrR family transcriptional regulator|uniref:TetR/AcrR family transcriptional regulator n=1 Tax=Pseudomonas sp. NPDC088368 TaxID=3364453 RepID=UPI0038003EA6
MEPKIAEPKKRSRGRPSAFDRATAVQRAMRLFWESGYEGTSFDVLITAMGISASSFYNAFGSKEQLYAEATDAYLTASGEWFIGILNENTDARAAFTRLLETTASEFTRDDLPAGCMISVASVHVPPALQSVRDMMTQHRTAARQAMEKRIQRGIDEGDVPADTNVQALAGYLNALSRGLAVHARDGATPEQLLEIVQVAMQAFPDSPKITPGI